jgi:hypothetical protein
MSVKVDLDQLAGALADFTFAYLVRSTTAITRTLWLSSRCSRTAWPPSQPGGYTLIVDGRGQPTDADAALTIAPSRAVLHRKAAPDSPATANGCLHDYSG